MVCVFDMLTTQNNFGTNGERILNPLSCMIHQEENGDYSVDLVQPILPDDDCYTFLKPYNIIKVTSGQLFPIYSVTRKMQNGVPVIQAKARHISYFLNDKVTYNVKTADDGWWCNYTLSDIFGNADFDDSQEGLVGYNFTWYSDITGTAADKKYAEFNGVSVGKAIMDCCSIYGGYLYRDNFYISICRDTQYSKENAFSCIHGWNCTEITETIDVSEQCTEVHSKDNLGNGFAVARVPDLGFPHHSDRFVQFNYDSLSNLDTDTMDYYALHREANRAYSVKLVDLKDTSRALGWDGLERVKVGDKGSVYSSLLDINQIDMRIVSTDFNELSQRNENVNIANFIRSPWMHPQRFEQIITKPNAEAIRLNRLEREAGFFEYVED